MVREAPQDVPKNGKRYHIHTFGCQVSSWMLTIRGVVALAVL
jgi:hypothetical protein